MKIRVQNIVQGKVDTENFITGIRTVKDIDRVKGPGITTEVIIKLKAKGRAKITMPDKSTMEMILMND